MDLPKELREPPKSTDPKVIEKAAMKVISFFCKKSKKICAWCECSLTRPAVEERVKEVMASGYTGRLVCGYVDLSHPKYKSQKFRLCGDCYHEHLRRTKAYEAQERAANA